MSNSAIVLAKNGELYSGIDIAANAHWCLPELLKFQTCFYFRLEGTKVFLTVVMKAPWPFGESRIELELNSNAEFELSFFKIVSLTIGVKDWRVDNKNVCFTMYAAVCALSQCLRREEKFCLAPSFTNAVSSEDDAFKALVGQMLMEKSPSEAGKCNCHNG